MPLLPILPPAEYKVVGVVRHAVFAGKLGQRVSEDLLIGRDGLRALIHVRGTYHTLSMRAASMIREGDTITIRGAAPGEGDTVDRERIRRVKA